MGLSAEEEGQVGKALIQLRLMGAALIMGVLSFLAVAAFLRGSGAFTGVAMSLPLPLPALGLLVGLGPLAFSFVLKGNLLRPESFAGLPPQDRLPRVLSRYRQATIVALALCEGGAFMVLVSTLISTDSLVWAAAALVPMGGMIFHFPTRLALEACLDDARRLEQQG
ncbi:MAG: hypothetical protein M5U26_21990 [Planctomycetota bacterium]|nr:hypothetical protein [Planctomycetota bacterium]